MIDPYAEYGESAAGGAKPRPTNYHREALQKRQKEIQQLAGAARAAQKRWLEKTLACPEGPRLTAMIAWIKTLGPDDAALLVDTVKAQPWLLSAGEDFRFAALRLIGAEIERIRKEAGLPPFADDPVVAGDEERPSVFFLIKQTLKVS